MKFNFRRLQTRLTVLYMGLFGFALILVAVAVVTAVTGSARTVVRGELSASGQVYDQIWKSRSDQLRQGAAVLAQDYGFRDAVSTNDEATVRSALDNLRGRQKVDGALIVGVDGYVTAAGLNPDDAAIDTLYKGLESGKADAGVLTIGDQPYQAVAAPIMAPVLIGWVVFVEHLDQSQMKNLESLSAIPLSATVVTQRRLARHGRDDQPDLEGRRRPAYGPQRQTDHGRTPDGAAMLLAKAPAQFRRRRPGGPGAQLSAQPGDEALSSLFLALAGIGLAGLAS
jgi:hypothetical protein